MVQNKIVSVEIQASSAIILYLTIVKYISDNYQVYTRQLSSICVTIVKYRIKGI